MRLSIRLASAALVGVSMVAAGCYEEPTVQVHEPGEYQGAVDPLLQVAGTPEQNERLASRFLAIQTDR